MSIIEKCLYCRGVGKKRCDCTIDFMAIIICNANRTESSPIWSVIIRVVNKIGRLRQWLDCPIIGQYMPSMQLNMTHTSY